jgi:hypothetical protein
MAGSKLTDHVRCANGLRGGHAGLSLRGHLGSKQNAIAVRTGEAAEQLAIQWFVLKFVEKSAGVFHGQPVVAFTDRLCDLIVHLNVARILNVG